MSVHIPDRPRADLKGGLFLALIAFFFAAKILFGEETAQPQKKAGSLNTKACQVYPREGLPPLRERVTILENAGEEYWLVRYENGKVRKAKKAYIEKDCNPAATNLAARTTQTESNLPPFKMFGKRKR